MLYIAYRVCKKCRVIIRGKFAFNILPQVEKVQKVIRLKSRLVYFHTFTVILSDLCYLVCERTKLNFLKYLIVDRTIAYKLFVG